MLIVKTSLTAAGVGSPGGPVLAAPLVHTAHAMGAFIGGGFALEQGFLYSAMIWAAIVVCIVDRRWTHAAAWSGIGALLALCGLMHSYVLTGRDTAINLPLLDWLNGHWTPGRSFFPAGDTAVGYVLAALLFLGAKYFTVPRQTGDLA